MSRIGLPNRTNYVGKRLNLRLNSALLCFNKLLQIVFSYRFSDRRELPVDLRQKILNGVLYIEPVQKATDSGTYTCNARNKQGQSARRSGEVFVIGMVLFNCFGYSLTNVFNRVSLRGYFRCEVTN